MDIIDGHAHACGSYYDASAIKAYMEQHHFDKVVLCCGEPGSQKNYGYPMISSVIKDNKLGFWFNKLICKVASLHKLSAYIDEQNSYVYQLAVSLPNQVINAYWINPNEDNCIEKMQAFYEKNSFKLIKMHQCWTKFDIKCENCHLIFKWAQKYRMPVFIHLLSQEQVASFADMANSYSETKFIVAHMIGADYMNDKLKNENVYFDLSAPQLYSFDTLKKALAAYGAERIILGSDTPYGKNNIEINLNRLKQCNLSSEEIAAIAGSNMKELLK